MNISEGTLYALTTTVGKAKELKARAEDANRIISDLVFSLGWAMSHEIIPANTVIPRLMSPDMNVSELHSELGDLTDKLRSFENALENVVAHELYTIVDSEGSDG